MTLKEFFRKARRGRTWRCVDGEFGGTWIRCEDGLCPMAAVAPRHEFVPRGGGAILNSDAERLLGLPRRTVVRIAQAADYDDSRHRPWLLKNLGVSLVGAGQRKENTG